MTGAATGRTGWCTMRRRPRNALDRVCSDWVTYTQDGARYCHECTYWWHEYTETQSSAQPRPSWRQKRELRRIGSQQVRFKPRKIA